MLLNCENLGKSFGGELIFKGLSLRIEPKDKIALVGRNGCGKSTLLKVLMGELESDEGTFKIMEKVSVGYLEQKRYDTIGSHLSGGEATKKELVELFETNPSILFLDEPTNHLDLSSIEWLEEKIKSFKGALVIVSHDRYFLDKCVNHVLDMNREIPKLYKGNYSDYFQQKEIELISQRREYDNQQREIERQEAVIRKLRQFNRQKSIKRADSRQKLLDRVERIEIPKDEKTMMSLNLTPEIEPGKDVLFVSGLKKSFGEKRLFSDVGFDIRRGEHIALIGANGTGKTTILKILTGSEEADEGSFKIGTNVNIGYYDQAQQNLTEDKSIFDEIHDDFPYLTETKVRQTLAAFSFFEDDIGKKIESLSGGERGRVSLAKLMLSEANFLLLDEPTNHLDMESREILEDAINSYTGTLLYVSHDRYFVNCTADRILDLSGESIRNYLGNYDDYLEKRRELLEKGLIVLHNECINDSASKEAEPSEGRLSWEEAKRLKSEAQRKEREIKKFNQEIESIEMRIDEIDKLFLDSEIATNGVKLRELTEEKDYLEERLLELYGILEEYEKTE